MKTTLHFFLVIPFFGFNFSNAQTIGDFTSVTPTTQNSQFVIPSSHTFQVLAETGDAITGGTLPDTPDFTGYVPATGSTNGYLSLSHEKFTGAVTVFDINYNVTTRLWQKTASVPIDFTSTVGITRANCSGTVTPWNTIITCEEASVPFDFFPPFDGYYDNGWNIEIDPATKMVHGKHWAMGNFAHENVVIHSNERTVYQGADSNPGYLFKFVATTAQDLSSGSLYVYKGSKNGSGNWILLNNTSVAERNSTLTQCGSSGVDATVFNGIEDVEIDPDGKVYFAVKGSPDQRVYRFDDSDPISGTSVTNMETFVGNMSYNVNNGSSITSVAWGSGNDNLAFDGDGNLWVMQDGGNHYMWVVKNGHTQAIPDVEIFGIAPSGAEPTGITFTPDYKYLFMSIQHPNSGNTANQVDAAGNTYNFEKGTTLVIALNENLGSSLSANTEKFNNKFELYPNPLSPSQKLRITANDIKNIKLFTIDGRKLLEHNYNALPEVELKLQNLNPGIYIVKMNDSQVEKLLIK